MPKGRSFMPISECANNSLYLAMGGDLRRLLRVWWSSPGLQCMGCRGNPICASEVTGNGWALGWKAGIITYGMFTCWVKGHREHLKSPYIVFPHCPNSLKGTVHPKKSWFNPFRWTIPLWSSDGPQFIHWNKLQDFKSWHSTSPEFAAAVSWFYVAAVSTAAAVWRSKQRISI